MTGAIQNKNDKEIMTLVIATENKVRRATIHSEKRWQWRGLERRVRARWSTKHCDLCDMVVFCLGQFEWRCRQAKQ